MLTPDQVHLRKRPHSPVTLLTAVDDQPQSVLWPEVQEQCVDLMVHVWRCEAAWRLEDRIQALR